MESDKHPSLRIILLAALLVTTVLFPPELSPVGLALAVALAAGLGILHIWERPFKEGSQGVGRWIASVMGAYLLLSVFRNRGEDRQ